MKMHRAAAVCLLAISLFGCVDSRVQHREAPLPATSAEQRAQDYTRDARALNPSLSRDEAAAQAAAAAAGQDAKAEAEWRQSQKDAAEREKFIKDLDTVTGGK